MKRINNEIYISPEIAKLLKEVGFDWKCKYAYIITPKGDMATGEENMLIEYVEDVNWLVKAPTLEIVQRWLREVKHEFVGIYPVANKWFYSILRPNFGHYYKDKQFNTYEEAQEAGIKKCLELILKKMK